MIEMTTEGRADRRTLLRPELLAALAAIVVCVVATSPAQANCPAPPPAIRDIALPRFYGDKEGSQVDAKLAATHKAAVAPLTAFVRQVTQDADKSWKRAKPEGQIEVGRCALHWIETWAKSDAWLGKMETKQAEYQRKWDLAGVALAYIKLRRFAEPAQRANGFNPSAEAFLASMSRIAEAPSFNDEELPAVTDPSFLNAGLSMDNLSMLESSRTVSSRA